MLFTNYILRNTCDISEMTKEDFKYFNKFVTDTEGQELYNLLYKPDCITFCFDKGIGIFEIFDDMHKKERVCFIHTLAKKKKGKQSENWDGFLNEFYKFLRLNKCMKIKMCTKLPAKFWIEEYGFKLKRYQMELDL